MQKVLILGALAALFLLTPATRGQRPDEVEKLKKQNELLQKEIQRLKKEIEQLKKAAGASPAAAKGAGEKRVMLHHALRNALIPTLTIIGFSFAYLITGAVLTETVFSWPGIGSYAVSSARSLDFPAIIGVTLVGSLAFLLANLATDLAYALANPRVKLQ